MKARIVCAAGAALCWSAAASAQVMYQSDFESPTYTGSPAGTVMTGVDGWYLPTVGGVDGKVVTYAGGNTYNVAANPSGGAQFAQEVATNALNARSQHDLNFSSGGKWKAEFDCYAKWVGATLPANDNIGSFSLQDSVTTRYFQQLMCWGTTVVGPAPNATNYTATADKFHIAYGSFTAATPTTIAFLSPGPEWRDLLVEHWYRCSVTWDFTASQILECSIQDLTAGGPVTTVNVTANNWYLQGGPASTMPLPTAFRLFGGGTTAAGTVSDLAAFDNVKITKIVSCYPDCNGDGQLNLSDFGCFQTAFALGQPYADCNGDGVRNLSDFGCFQTKFALGCP